MRINYKITLIGIFFSTYLLGAPFTTNGKYDTVTDLATKLIWQRCNGSTGFVVFTSPALNCNSDTTGSIKLFTWSEAISYCNTLILSGRNDWRLPNINELGSIVDYEKSSGPAITGFVNTQSNYYWSSSTDANYAGGAWAVNFSDGAITILNSKTSTSYVRCVAGP